VPLLAEPGPPGSRRPTLAACSSSGTRIGCPYEAADAGADADGEMLGLLRFGDIDAEIAARLHLSTRTVEHHVSAVLRKTGVRPRRDLRDAQVNDRE